MRKIRGERISMIFQQPTSSLNPVWDVGHPDRGGPAHPPGLEGQGRRGAHARAPAHGRHSRPGPPAQGVPARDVRRDGAADHDRDGACVRARAADRRRAHHRPRRDDPGPDPRPHAQSARRDRHRDHPHHPRPGGGRRDVRSGGSDVRRRDRRADRRRDAVPRAAASVYPRPHRIDPGRRRPPRGAGGHPRERAEPDRPARGLPLRPALPGPDRGGHRQRVRRAPVAAAGSCRPRRALLDLPRRRPARRDSGRAVAAVGSEA